METDFSLGGQLLKTYQNALSSAVAATPRVMTGLILAVVALILAKLVENVLRAMLLRLRFDDILGRAGIDKSLQRVGVRQSLTFVLPRIAYFLLLLLFAQTGSEGLGLHAIAGAISAFMAYLPNVIAAFLLLVIGSAVGQFAGNSVAEAARNSGIDYAASLGSMVSALILFVVGIMALAQLKINTDIIRIVTLCFLSGLALAFGLSFGLGTRDVTRNIIAGFYARKIFRAGEPMEIRGERGILKAITPTQTLLETEQHQTVAISNSVYLEETVRQ